MKKAVHTLCALFLAIALTLPAWAAGLSPIRSFGDGGLTDVPNDWSRDGIVACYELGLMSGKGGGLFAPAGTVTVAEGISVAGRVRDLWRGGTGELPVSYGRWYDGAVTYALSNGMIAMGQFPDYEAPASRAELAFLLTRALPADDYTPINQITTLPDVDASTAYAKEILTLYNAGILTGGDAYGTFSPDSTITRAELATILGRLVQPDTRKVLKLTTEVKPVDTTVRSTNRRLLVNGVGMVGVVEIDGEFYLPGDIFDDNNMTSRNTALFYEEEDYYLLDFNSRSSGGEVVCQDYRTLPPAGRVIGVATRSPKPLRYQEENIADAVYTLDGKYPMIPLSALGVTDNGTDLILNTGAEGEVPTLVLEHDLIGAAMTDLIQEDTRATIKAIHDYLVSTLTYDPLTSAPRGITQAQLEAVQAAFDAAGEKYTFSNNISLEAKYGICQNYADLFFAMCTRAGIPCRVVSGMAGSGSHAWNQVYLDGQWLYVDCTWDDPVSSTPQLKHTYFLVGPEVMVRSHYWEESDYPMPAEYDPAWMLIDPMRITTADEFRKCLVAQLMQQKTSFSLRTIASGAYGGNGCVYAYPAGWWQLSGGYNSATGTYDYKVEY